jgi:hypothetical protein
LYLTRFWQPAAERTLYRAISGMPLRSIVELGIDASGRTQRVLEIAAWEKTNLPVRYTGIDLFEGRPKDQPGMTLKQAFAQLRLPQVKVQLVPGDPAMALSRVANFLAGTDLVLIAADQDRESLARSWTWLPRMLTPASLVFLEEPAPRGKSGPGQWRPLALAEIQRLASETSRRRRAA